MISSLLLLVACEGESGEPSGRPPFDYESDDTGGETVPPSDLDADGWTEKDGDCDDANPAVYPGAYDRPNDGIDADCADGDRTCDCLVLDAGTTEAATYEGIDTSAFRTLDLAYLPNTRPGTLAPEAFAASFQDVADALDTSVGSWTGGVATYDDYAYGDLGSAPSGDKPFELHAQQTDDRKVVQYALNHVQYHSGGDTPQAGMEALYQAFTGIGYDQDCDGAYDGPTDVVPFIADAADPFGGLAGQSYDSTDPSTGTGGGMGFREDATLRVLVYGTNADLRDPSAGYPSPGGCPGDADSADVTAAALDAGVYLVGISIESKLPLEQMLDLADATGSVADLDGDGAADDPLVYSSDGSTTDVRDAILGAVDALRTQAGLLDVYSSVTLEVRNDPLGIVGNISPQYSDVAWRDVDALVFNVAYYTTAYGAKPVDGSVDLALVGDGFDLATVQVDVEVAPL